MIAVIVSLLLVAALAVSGTVAWLNDNTDPVVNTFSETKMEIEVEEVINGNVKNDVTVENKSEIPVYVRAMVVVTWQNSNGDVYATAPEEGTDYNIIWSGIIENGGWIKGSDGIYYHTTPVADGDSTKVLFTGCEPVDEKTPDGYELHVEILASCVQATPVDAVTDAWHVTVDDNGSLTN